MNRWTYGQEYERCRLQVEDALATFFQGNCAHKELLDAMRYSLLAGGKRVRPVLLLKFCEAAGGDVSTAMPLACALEMLHTYSLIHDDLPCMDNDVLRRGKPTNHTVFGVCTATLAGDALQAAAFRTLFSADLDPEVIRKAGMILGQAAGENGICGGQYLDMKAEGKLLDVEGITQIHTMKTAAMLRAAAVIGVLSAGPEPDRERAAAADKYAAALGLAFQIRDDMLDCISTSEEMGKTVGSDLARGKSTFVSLLGIDACGELVEQKTKQARLAIKDVFPDTGFLEWLADDLAGRER